MGKEFYRSREDRFGRLGSSLGMGWDGIMGQDMGKKWIR